MARKKEADPTEDGPEASEEGVAGTSFQDQLLAMIPENQKPYKLRSKKVDTEGNLTAIIGVSGTTGDKFIVDVQGFRNVNSTVI